MIDTSQLPIYIGAFFLIIGEWKRDNIYRSIAGICSLWATFATTFPTGGDIIMPVVALYCASMWYFQPSIRAQPM